MRPAEETHPEFYPSWWVALMKEARAIIAKKYPGDLDARHEAVMALFKEGRELCNFSIEKAGVTYCYPLVEEDVDTFCELLLEVARRG